MLKFPRLVYHYPFQEEVKELAKTSWLYEANDPRANTRVKL